MFVIFNFSTYFFPILHACPDPLLGSDQGPIHGLLEDPSLNTMVPGTSWYPGTLQLTGLRLYGIDRTRYPKYRNFSGW